MSASAAMPATTTVEATPATVETTSTMEAAAMEATRVTAAAVETAAVTPAAVAPTTPPSAPAAAPAIPRAGTDEYPAHKPIRAVISVGRAGIRCVAIISILASWRPAHIAWANANADADLRLGVG